MRSSAFVAVIVALAALAASAGEAGVTASGLRGTVSLTPAAPVCLDDGDCTKPAPNFTLLFTRVGKSPVRVVTSTDGRYRVMLPPGTYAVTAPRLRPIGRITPAVVRVRRALVTVVDLLVDTGIQ